MRLIGSAFHPLRLSPMLVLAVVFMLPASGFAGAVPVPTRDPSAGSPKSTEFMHARYYSSDFGRFLSVDPFGGKEGSSQSWNRYSYVLNSPMVFVDPYGESVSLANLDDEQREKLLQDLNDFTGNTYDVNDEGDLLLVDAGDVARGEASAKAALFMDSLISSDRVYSVLASPGSNQARVTGEEGCVEINFASKDGMIAPDGVDPATFNLGSTLIHELRHEAVGLRDDFGAPPGTDLLEWSGPIIDFVNDIRAERGLYLRKAWGYKPVTRGFFRLREFREHEFYRPGERPMRILVPR